MGDRHTAGVEVAADRSALAVRGFWFTTLSKEVKGNRLVRASVVSYYMHEDEQRALRVGQAGVSLDSVVIAFQEGLTAESIQQQYPALSLEEVYGAITYYLANREAVERYLDQQLKRWEELRQRVEQTPSPVVERLRAMRRAPVPEGR